LLYSNGKQKLQHRLKTTVAVSASHLPLSLSHPPQLRLYRVNGGLFGFLLDKLHLMTRKALGLSHKSDDFQNEGILGSGGYAAVERVRHKKSRKFYARKVIAVRPPLTVDFCVQEINVMERLDHRHVIKLISSEILSRRIELVLPLADEDLSTYMSQFQENRLPDDIHNLSRNLQKWIGCLSSGLTYLHEQSVRHKDIKPQNILLMGDRVMYTDFGIARDFTDSQFAVTSGDLRGTPMYCAPEVFNEQKRDKSADIFSLGCVYLEMLVCLSQRSFSDFLGTRFGDGHSRSYQAHIEPSRNMIDMLIEDNDEPSLYTALFLCKKMLQEKASSRPSAFDLSRRLCTKAELGCEQCVDKPSTQLEATPQDTPSSSQDTSTSHVSRNTWTVKTLTKVQWQLGIAFALLAVCIPLLLQVLYPAYSFWALRTVNGPAPIDVNSALSATTNKLSFSPESESVNTAATTAPVSVQTDPPTALSVVSTYSTPPPAVEGMFEATSNQLKVYNDEASAQLKAYDDKASAALYGTQEGTSTSASYQAPQKIFHASQPQTTTRDPKNMRRARRLLLDWLLALSVGLLFTCIGPFKSSDSETLLGFRIICVVYTVATYAVWHSHDPGDFWSVADTWASKSAHNISTLLCGVGPVIWVSTYIYQGHDGGWGVLLMFWILFIPVIFLCGHGICAFLVYGGWNKVFNAVTYYMF
jgi:serine/threonine protein kinase